MMAVEAYRRLKEFTVFRTVDAAALLNMGIDASNKILSRLATQGLLIKVCRGLWTWPETDPNILPEYISAPAPSYLSFQTALFNHGLISQIPRVIYVATLGRARRVQTLLGTFSFHHLPPELFGGFDSHGVHGIKMASAEKALFDFVYLMPARSRLFAKLPELELLKGFDGKKMRYWIKRIPSLRRRRMVEEHLEEVLSKE
mgnify:CR=1 FL=1